MSEPLPEPIRVLGIAGSLRSGSYNRALIHAAQELAPDGMEIDMFDLSDVPLYNRDVEDRGDPAPVTEMKQAIAEADALLIATPEYQHGVPGVLKNALDWASRPPSDSPMLGKVAAIMGATPGRFGTARAQEQLRQALNYTKNQTVLQPEVLVAAAGEKFDDQGRLTDETTRDFIAQLLDALADLTYRMARADARELVT